MIKSMTGFARTQKRAKSGIYTAEIKSLNHKFLDISCNLPNDIAAFEDKVKNLIKLKIKRGKVYCTITHEILAKDIPSVKINETLAKQYAKKLKKIKKIAGIKESIKMTDLLSFPGVVEEKSGQKDVAKLWPSVKEAVLSVLDRLVIDRGKEGRFLLKDITKRIKRIKKIMKDIKKSSSFNVKRYKQKLSERIKELSKGLSIDKGRLEIEVALFAKNSDITEELIRIENHLENFSRTIKKGGEAGKKLDFITQELHRETNTIGSKASGFNISRGVIEVKTEIEKIREQLKNIE